MKKNNWKAYLLRVILILGIGLLAGTIAESLYELNTCRRAKKGGYEIEKEEISKQNITIIDNGVVAEGEQKTKTIHVQIPERYVNKLRYDYSSEVTFTPNIQINTKDIYKNPEMRTIKDISRYNLNESVINIKDYVTEVRIIVPSNVEIGKIIVDNTWDFNWYRVFYISIFVSLILFVINFRGVLAKKIEYGFAVISLSCGLLFIAIQPPECVSWDEHIHFSKTFDWFENGIADRSISEDYIYNNQEDFERSAFFSKEEKSMQIEYLNENADTVASTYERNAFSLNAVGEFHMAFLVKVVKHLGLSFYGQYLIAKIANLLLYTILMFFAIRIAPIGKKFLAVTALMPSAMLQSVSITYDVVVIGFTVLGFTCIVKEFYEIQTKFTWKKLFFITMIFVIGSCPKPVYIFLLATLLALPKTKFSSDKQRILMKGIIVIVCLCMIMTMLLPAAAGAVEGDERGGDTNVMEQFALVLTHPFAYIKIFFKDVWSSLDAYLFGSESLGFLAYANMHPWTSFLGVFSIGVALTEKKKKLVLNGKTKIMYKVWLGTLIFVVIGLIWSSLYIVFTPVGATSILGVQARYYLPLLYPLCMAFYSEKIEGKWNEKTYTMIILLVMLWVTHGAFYQQYFLTYCQ